METGGSVLGGGDRCQFAERIEDCDFNAVQDHTCACVVAPSMRSEPASGML